LRVPKKWRISKLCCHNFVLMKQLIMIDEKVNKEEKVILKVLLDGNSIELKMDPTNSILQTLMDEGYDPPHSCTSGVCTTCMARLVKGEVFMDVNYGLDDEEVNNGFILTCQSHPTTPEIEVDYDY
jgi:ferredoxin